MPLLTHEFLQEQIGRRYRNREGALSAAKNTARSETAILAEALKSGEAIGYDVFLSHRYIDAAEVIVMRDLLIEEGYKVFVDWIEMPDLDRNEVSRLTAETIRNVLRNCKTLVYVYSKNSGDSVWMPWELGFFDGCNGRVVIAPVGFLNPGNDAFTGTEYLGLYFYLTRTKMDGNGVVFWVNESPRSYVTLKGWVNGKNPYDRRK